MQHWITRNAMRREKTQARTLPTLKRMMEDKIRRELAKEKKEKEKKATMADNNNILSDSNQNEEPIITKEDLESISDKDFEAARKTDKEKLHQIMDQRFRDKEEQLHRLSQKSELDDYWKIISRTIENAWNEHLKLDKDTAKKNRGRGEVKITRTTPKTITSKDNVDTIRNEL